MDGMGVIQGNPLGTMKYLTSTLQQQVPLPLLGLKEQGLLLEGREGSCLGGISKLMALKFMRLDEIPKIICV